MSSEFDQHKESIPDPIGFEREREQEQKICEMMASILKVPTVDRNQSFLDMGGHSLEVMVLKNRLENYFNVELSYSDVFKSSSPRSLAQFISQLPKRERSQIIASPPPSKYSENKIKANEAQKLIYFATLSHIEPRAYNTPVLIQLTKKLSIDQIHEGFIATCNHHPALMSSFIVENGELFQQLNAVTHIPFHVMNLSPQDLHQAMIDFAQPFSVAKGPLVRAALFDDGRENYHLLVDFHHLVMDGVSLEVFLGDLKDFLKDGRFRTNSDYRTAVLSADSIPQDAILWKNAETYWNNFLRKPLRNQRLPGKVVKFPGKSSAGKQLQISLSKDLTQNAQIFCNSRGVTLHSFFLAVLNILLSKLTFEEEILIGVPSNGRIGHESEGAVGMFVRTLPSRHQVLGHLRFSDFLEEVHSQSLKRLDYQFYPLQEKNSEKLDQSSFNYSVVYTTQRFNLDLKKIGRIKSFYYPFAHFPLLFSLIETKKLFNLVIEYDVEQFDSETVQSYAQSFLHLCKQILMEEEREIHSLSLLSDAESLLIINRFNSFNRQSIKIKEKCRLDNEEDTLISRFKKVAKINPDRTAVQSFKKKISYKDLDELTDRIAHTLCQEGVSRGHSIAVLAEREVDYVVAILSILKAGATYVPLDIDYPTVRLEAMLETAQCNYCLSLQSKDISLSVTTLTWSEIFKKAQFYNDFQTQVNVGVNSRAYVMFTSGSTGKPKGVGISHRNILRLVEPNNIVPLNKNTNILLTGSPSFDATTYEIWGPLLNGGTVALIDKMSILDSKLLSEAIVHFETNTMWMTAPLFARMAYENPCLFQGINYLIVGGDIVSPEAVRLVQEATPEVNIVNGYGPTENTTFSTFYLIPQGVNYNTIPVGRPLVKSTAYIMDKGGNLLPPTALGELYVGGAGVSEGYVNYPLNLSRQDFIEYQWPEGEFEYLYRTGDLAYWDGNGLIHFLGRSDSQVKVRGMRIEPNEVQGLLLQHPDIQDAYVTLAKEQELEGLAAYIVFKNPINMDEILTFLHDNLPSHMIPTFYLEVDSLPLNINGKISKEQLPEKLKVLRRVSQKKLTETFTYEEREIAGIWSELLGIESPGLDDLFFRIGGDSIKVVILASRLGKLYKRPSITSLYSLNTIRKQAKYFASLKRGENKNKDVSIFQSNAQQSNLDSRVKASEAQKRLFVLDQVTSGRAPYLIPILLKVNGKLNINRLKDSWFSLRQRHQFLRSRFMMDPDQNTLWIELEREDSPETLSVLKNVQDSQLSDWLENRLNSFTLTDCGVARLDILETGQDQFYLAFIFHHIAVDGVSVEVILEELAAYYRGESLPPLEISSFGFWKNREKFNDMKNANSYWSNLLDRSISEIQLPNDFPRRAQQQNQGETVYLPLSHEIRKRVNEFAQDNDVTPFMVYLAAFTVLLNRYSRQKDFNLGTVASGRLEEESTRLVGMLVNTLPLRIQLDPDWTFSQLLIWLKKEVLSALDHQEFSFEDIVSEFKSERESWRNPLFNVLFSRIVSGPVPCFGSGTILEKQDWNYPTAKFDLTLFVLEEVERSRVAVEFASDVLLRTSAERILNHYLKLLENILINSNEPIKAISFLPESERKLVLNTFNDTSAPYNRNCLIHQLFELQVFKTPNALAVQQGVVLYTYIELEMRTNQLASALRKSGVTRGVPVLVITDRTPEMIVAVIAVLKAGGFYVPVEIDIPEKRLMEILEILQISHALTDQGTLLESKIDDPKFNTIKKIICIDSDFSHESSERLSPVTISQDLAYVIFTSGSTGSPKGVKVSHRPVINLIEWVNQRYAVDNHDKLLFVTSLCFDLSVYDIFGILAAGGTIRVAHGNEVKDPQHLAQIVEKEKITFWDSAPGVIQQILHMVKPNTVFSPHLRLVFLSGDWIPVSVPGALKKLSPEVLVVALGGATEATVWSNYFEVKEDCSNWESIPYGNPIQNAQYYILDELNHPSPIGVPGRLFIGGECLAEGYAGPSKLTEDRFIKNPFSNTSGAVMYHTGDLACWRSDGKMRFLGREDHQVKIRGYRVELSDVTHSLKQHPAVREVITLAQPDPAGQKSLVAYVLCHYQISSYELSNFLVTQLPAYMIPSWYSFLEEFPVTQNGKFDLKQLPGIPELISQQNERLQEQNHEASGVMNEIEKHIHNLWCQILGRAIVPIGMSFYQAGGNSLLLVKLHKLLEMEWPGFFTIPDLFVIATISSQASHVVSREGLKLINIEEIKQNPVDFSNTQSSESSNEPIAIIGIAGKWPGADNLMDFWKLNMEGIPQTRPFPTSRQKKVKDTMKSSRPSAMQVGAFFDQIEEFDPEFFGISVREAELMDPIQRQFLSIAWLAFEDAHYPLPILKGRSVGIYVGYCVGSEDLTYGQLIRENSPELYPIAFTGNLPPVIAGRVSHLYDLRGPSLVIDTACSSSLVAVHQACQALYQSDCEMALVGGVKFHLLPLESGDSIGIESKDGMTRAFAGGLFGTGIGEGVAAIVLKPLSKALRDQDEIYATIVGTACNQDGLTSGLTVPSTVAQQSVIEQAWIKAEKHSDDQNLGDFHMQIGYLEAHGTGTQLGDPIEFEALSQVFKKRAPNLRQHCAVGSAKSLVGHLDSAAGITGLIRSALILKKGIIFPSLHFIQPNDKIDYLSSALYVNDLPAQWPEDRQYCGISAFSMSGTNCHVVLKEPPKLERMKVQQTSDFSGAKGVVMLSAHSLESLHRYIKILIAHIVDYQPLFGSLLRSLSTRHHFEFRIALIADSTERVVQLLSKTLAVWPNIEKVEDCEASFGERSLAELPNSNRMDSVYQLAQEYVRKESLDWRSVYKNFMQCHLPGYVFATRELWFANEPDLAPEQEDLRPINNDAEQTARSLWKSILGTSHISDDVDFFQGGGDSLRATFFISRLSNVLGLKINPAQLWRTPTLKSLLEYIRTISQEPQGESYTLETVENLSSYPLTPAQKYIYVHSILNNDVLYNVPIGLKLMGPLDLELLKKHLTNVINADPVFSLIFENYHGNVVQTLRTKDENNLDNSSRLQFEVFQCPEVLDQDGSILQQIMTTFIRPFDICKGPLARFAVVRKNDQEHILLMDFHHLIMDGVSVSIFVKRLYQAYKEGMVAAPKFAFTDFIFTWEKQRGRDGFDKHHQHWKTQLKTKKGGIINRLGENSTSVVGSRYTISLNQKLSQSLILFSRNSGYGLFATLAGTYALALKSMFNQDEFNIGTPMSGRLLNGMENILGMFVNLYPIPIKFSSNLSDEMQSDTIMSGIRSWLADAIQFQDFPMKLVQTETTEEMNSSKFNVMFALQNMDISPTTIQDDLNAIPIPFYDLPWNVTKFDLSLYSMEVGKSIVLSFEYKNEVLTQEDILQLSKNMEKILYRVSIRNIP